MKFNSKGKRKKNNGSCHVIAQEGTVVGFEGVRVRVMVNVMNNTMNTREFWCESLKASCVCM